MGKFIDMTGWRMSEHGVPNSRLTVIGLERERILPNGIKLFYWKCKCDCGNYTVVQGAKLRNINGTKSCGCAFIDATLKRRNHNIYIDRGNYLEGYDTKGNCFLIDKEDYDKIKDYYWQFSKANGYWCASRQKNNRKIFLKLHQIICPTNLKDLVPDHYNRNTSDNRKSNLILKSRRENAINSGVQSNNSSGFIGVQYCKSENRWRASINLGIKQTRIVGRFKDKDEAIFCRLCYECVCYKENAPQRNLFNTYKISKEIADEYCNNKSKRKEIYLSCTKGELI